MLNERMDSVADCDANSVQFEDHCDNRKAPADCSGYIIALASQRTTGCSRWEALLRVSMVWTTTEYKESLLDLLGVWGLTQLYACILGDWECTSSTTRTS